MQTSGLILDVYDDFQGDVLSTIYSSTGEVPDMVKSAHRLTDHELGALPDDVFALVAVTDGGHRMRKFACTDPGNTVMSVEYLLKTAHKLPEEAQGAAARNLVVACGWYGLQPPPGLLKMAGIASMLLPAAMAVPLAQGAAGEAKQNLQQVRQAPPGKIVNPFAKHAQGAMGGAMPPAPGAGVSPMQPPMQPPGPMASMGMPSAPMPPAGAQAPPAMTAQPPTPVAKMAEASLPSVMPASSEGSARLLKRKAPIKTAACDVGEKRARLKAAMMKKAEIGHLVAGHGSETGKGPDTGAGPAVPREPHEKVFRQGLDLRGKEPPVKVTEKKAQHVALGRYPMDDIVQIKMAAAYFETWGHRMSPEDRRGYCSLLVKRADAIGRPGMVSYDARKYGSTGYAPPGEVKMAMDMRKSALNDLAAHRVLDALLEKMATVGSEVFCETLSQFDQQHGLQHHYDAHVPDPYWSTFGFDKTAMTQDKDDELSSVGTETISRSQLVASADPAHSMNILTMLNKRFGKEFRDEWQKSPISIFESLPLEQKVFIARFINDNGPGAPAVEM